ncbi:MAG: MoaD/ThiS family protein [Paracoccaceae bacterium]|jgi:sulfur-carrier protein|nr:MoaD/ThiS family protein [Paracoccaceae bacterium]
MVEINLWAGLRTYANGSTKIEVDAKTVGEVLDGLKQRFPGLADYLEDNVSVVVDGCVIVSGLQEPVTETSEVWLMKRLRGG